MNDTLRQLLEYMNQLAQPDPAVAQQIAKIQQSVPNPMEQAASNYRSLPTSREPETAPGEAWDRPSPSGSLAPDPVFGTGLDVLSAVTGAAEIPAMLRGGAEVASSLGQRAGAAVAEFNRPARAAQELAYVAQHGRGPRPSPEVLKAAQDAIMNEPENGLFGRMTSAARAGKNVIPRSRADLARTEAVAQDMMSSKSGTETFSAKVKQAEDARRAAPGETVYGGRSPAERNKEMADMAAKWLSEHAKSIHTGEVTPEATDIGDMLKMVVKNIEKTKT